MTRLLRRARALLEPTFDRPTGPRELRKRELDYILDHLDVPVLPRARLLGRTAGRPDDQHRVRARGRRLRCRLQRAACRIGGQFIGWH